MAGKGRADQVGSGVFLIGLAVLFMTGYWWPGIMFVIGFSSLARGIAEGRDWYSVPGGLWMIGIGLMFIFGFQWPLLLILIGASMLFGKSWQDRRRHHRSDRWQTDEPEVVLDTEKRKNDAPYYIDDSEVGDETTVEDLLYAEKRKNT